MKRLIAWMEEKKISNFFERSKVYGLSKLRNEEFLADSDEHTPKLKFL